MDSKTVIEISLNDLPKISLNEWYSGNHWTKRKKIKDNYKLIIKNQFKDVLSRDYDYKVNYMFRFKKNPLDVTNCIAMLKLIEDIIFESDKYDIIKKITVSSGKTINNMDDFVHIIIEKYS